MFNADDLKKEFLADIESAASEIQLSDVWKKYLSKTGSVQKLMTGIKEVAKEEKKAYGQFVNEVKTWVQEKYDEKKARIEAFELEQKYRREAIDVTVPVKRRPVGNRPGDCLGGGGRAVLPQRRSHPGAERADAV